MTGTHRAIPEGYHTITPYLMVKGADSLVTFLQQAFGAREIHRMLRPDGGIWHAEMQIGDSKVMLTEACEQMGTMPAALYLYVDDTDAIYRQALEAGASSLMEPADQFYGDRSAGIKDPYGNCWWIATHIEDVAPAEMEKRAYALAGKT